MKFTKFFGYIDGALIMFIGLISLFNPTLTYTVVGYAVGVTMILDAIALFHVWFTLRNTEAVDFWTLLGAIVSCALGIFLVGNTAAQAVVNQMIIYLAAVWFMIRGIVAITFALKIRNVHVKLNTERIGTRWWLRLITGILLIVFGIVCCLNPDIMARYIGISISLGVISTGMDVISFYARLV